MLHSNRRCNRPDIRSPQFGEYGRADPLQDCPGYSISHRRALPGTLHMTCQSLALTCRKLTDRRCAARAPIVQSGDVDRQVAEWWLKANRLQRNVVWDAACVRPRTVRSDRGRGGRWGEREFAGFEVQVNQPPRIAPHSSRQPSELKITAGDLEIFNSYDLIISCCACTTLEDQDRPRVPRHGPPTRASSQIATIVNIHSIY